MFSYWLPSSAARFCLSALHPATLVLLLFHKQLLQVLSPIKCQTANPVTKSRPLP